MRNIFKELKIFDIDPSRLRVKGWYKNTMAYHKYCLTKFSDAVKKPGQFVCPLCGGRKKREFLSHGKYHLFDCPRCSLVSANIAPDKFDKGGLYDEKKPIENIKRMVLSTYKYRKKQYAPERLEYILEKTKLPKSKIRLLDIGCGPGYFISHLKDKGVRYKGLELSDFLVDICRRQKLNVNNSNVSEEPNGRYSVITMFDVLEHLPDPISFMRMLNRKVSGSGYVLAYTPNVHSVAFQFLKEKQSTFAPFQHFCFYDEESLGFLARKTGFKIHSIDYYGLDLIDYFLARQHKDGYDYLSKIGELVPVLQAVIDKQKLSNHMRVLFKKSN